MARRFFSEIRELLGSVIAWFCFSSGDFLVCNTKIRPLIGMFCFLFSRVPEGKS